MVHSFKKKNEKGENIRKPSSEWSKFDKRKISLNTLARITKVTLSKKNHMFSQLKKAFKRFIYF